ncbi:hypothetical protein IMG5_110230 [Ichthyophthirius multifiliis]|uniref:Uncharacterized protein n=1 Tax=Ichthyophthirius multifiliis TaxID=5932 RepID=G0QTN4_ICHMU|nr:hypothetical protein IMG5_110230 [Ichthyophthirius multifiliis]EGR31407.1 hypothetical protein IMG5_110230 [Ichthyophthirius multifiliis]|eukprot:XP_004034893.1 hypothetical protein IMG5_110230 [Ichthyophthirius multifiliis]
MQLIQQQKKKKTFFFFFFRNKIFKNKNKNKQKINKNLIIRSDYQNTQSLKTLAISNNQQYKQTKTSTPNSRGVTPSKKKVQKSPISKKYPQVDSWQQIEGNQNEYYNQKLNILQEQFNTVQNQNLKLNKENENLRLINFEYVKKLNEISSSKLKAAEKIIINTDFFESENIQQKVKDFIRKLANNYKILEKEQTKLINYCKVMEADIENYKSKVAEAQEIQENLRKTGQESIESLVQSLKDLNDRLEQLTVQNKEMNFQLAIKNENIENLNNQISDLNYQQREKTKEYDNLVQKYNTCVSGQQEKQNGDGKIIYALKCKCDHLEHELRQMQGNLYINTREIQEMDIFLNIQDIC